MEATLPIHMSSFRLLNKKVPKHKLIDKIIFKKQNSLVRSHSRNLRVSHITINIKLFIVIIKNIDHRK